MSSGHISLPSHLDSLTVRLARFQLSKYAWSATLVASTAFLSWSLAGGAELRLRRQLIEDQANRTLITTSGQFDHVKSTINSLAKDCDLHAPIRPQDLRVAVVGEFMNACSEGPQPAEVESLTGQGPQLITGVLRIWFEHPGSRDEVLSEDEPLAPYTSSNPPHAVEIHPITSVGGNSYLRSLGQIEKDGDQFKAKGIPQLQNLLGREITVQSFDGADGEPFVSIESPCCLPNYFRLRASVDSKPQPTEDGHVAKIRVLRGNSVIARNLRLFSVRGTAADKAFAQLAKGRRFTFWGITRLDLSRILKIADDHPGEPSDIPVEFALLAVE